MRRTDLATSRKGATRRHILSGGLVMGLALTTGCAMRAGARAPRALPLLRVAARPDVLEAGPILHAAAALGEDKVRMGPGGVPNLIDGAVPGALDRFAGLADAAGQSETQLLRLSIANPQLRIVMTVTEGLYRIVARRSAGIASLQDLAGKRIATFEKTSAAFFLHRMLQSAGMRDADVTIVAMRPTEMAAALRERRIDAMTMWEPESELGAAAIGDDAISFSDPLAYRELYNLNTTTEVLEDPVRRAALVRFMRVLIASCRASSERPETIWPLVAKQSGFDPALVAASWPHHRFPANLPVDLVDVLVAEEAWLAAAEGRTPRDHAALGGLIDHSVLAEALA